MPPDPVETQPSTLVQENGHYLFQIRGLLKGTLMNTQCSLVYLYLHLQLKSSDRLHSYNPYSTAKPPVPTPLPQPRRKTRYFLGYQQTCSQIPLQRALQGPQKARVRNSGSLFQSNICNSFLPGIQLLSILQGCPLQRGTSGGSRPSDKGGEASRS